MDLPSIKNNGLNIHEHPRLAEQGHLVYPVLSRRAGGFSLGINANPDTKCSFNCVYCQVDRSNLKPGPRFDLARLESELDEWLGQIAANHGRYASNELKDIAVAGDGEPTLEPKLAQLLESMVRLKKKHGLSQVKLILFTNGTGLDRPDLAKVAFEFYANQGEIWCKLDFSHPKQMARVNRYTGSMDALLAKILNWAKKYPIILQSCFFRFGEDDFEPKQIKAYADRVQALIDQGAKIQKIQAYTLARKAMSNQAHPWPNDIMNAIGAQLKQSLDLEIELYYRK